MKIIYYISVIIYEDLKVAETFLKLLDKFLKILFKDISFVNLFENR